MLPVLEMAVVTATTYCKSTGRQCITATDMEYGLKFSARKVLGTQTESLFPDIYDEGDDEDSEDEVEDGDEEEFVRYTGDDPTICKINETYDTWDEWAPDSPIGIYLKNAIDAQTSKTVSVLDGE
jgi:hypothetical protein